MHAIEPTFPDPTIPGLSVRDLARRAVDALQGTSLADTSAARHRDFVIRRDLARLGQEALRDLGLDRGRA